MKGFLQQTYYEVLDVEPAANAEDIRQAYGRAVADFSTERRARHGAEEASAAEPFRARLLEAMEMLTDEDLRKEYDRSLGLSSVPPVVPAQDPHQLAMTEVLARADTTHSTHPEYRVSYFRHLPPLEPELLHLAAEEPRAAAPVPPPLAMPVAPVGAAPEGHPAAEPAAAAEIAHEAAIASAEAALAQVSSRAREARQDAKRGFEIAPDAEFNGELLRRAREARGLTLAEMAQRTRIGQRHLENVEADRYADLPTTVYLRGMLMNISRELRLDGLRVAKSYLSLVGSKAKV